MQKSECMELLNHLTEYLHQKGLTHVQYYIEHTNSLNVNVYREAVEKRCFSNEWLIFVEGEYQGFQAYGYLENPSEEYFDEFVKNIIETAQCNQEPYQEKALSKGTTATPAKESNPFPPIQELEKTLLDVEKCGYSYDKRIKYVDRCEYRFQNKDIILKDDTGIELYDHTDSVGTGIGVIAEENGDVQTDWHFQSRKSIGELDLKGIMEQTASRAVFLLGAEPLESGNYPVIFDGEIFAQILEVFIPVFCGDTIQQGMSLLKDKLGKQVAVPKLNLLEDPQHQSGVICRAIDDEGTPTQKKYLIENGILKQVLHNKETARKAGIESTGNGFKQSYREQTGVHPTNLILEAGDTSREEMEASLKQGVVITSIDGAFAGINTTSGDISIISKGYYIKDGKVEKPLTQITVAGNFFELLQEIEAIGNDLQFETTDISCVVAPSVLVRKLTISGK